MCLLQDILEKESRIVNGKRSSQEVLLFEREIVRIEENEG